LSFQTSGEPCPIQGDEIALREALKNVIDNALCYGARTLLHMEIRCTESAWELRVEDDGQGIDEAQWEEIRKPFASRQGSRQGASLGLSIVNEVMKAHKGSLQFSWSETRRFVVSLNFPIHEASLIPNSD
jgi:two-component system sensor histidine kinase TctE